MRLGTLLLRDARISLSQLEHGLQNQVINGGRLGTNLIELSYVDMDTMGMYLAKSCAMPLATPAAFEAVPRSLVDTLGAELANQNRCVPLLSNASSVSVAMIAPWDREAVGAIERAVRKKVIPHIAPELRILYYLEKFYGIRRRTRFCRATAARPPRGQRERRASRPLELRGNLAPPLEELQLPPRNERIHPLPAPKLSMNDALAQMQGASSRQEIADAYLQYSVGRFACAAVFSLQGRQALGFRARAPGLAEDSIERLCIPLALPSCFQQCAELGRAFRGRAPVREAVWEQELWKLLSLSYTPLDLHVVPVFAGARTVNLFYAHSAPKQTASDVDHRGIQVLARAAGNVYEELLKSH